MKRATIYNRSMNNFLYLLFPFTVVVTSMIITVQLFFPSAKKNQYARFILIGLAITYFVSLSIVSWDPYFDDNGRTSFIEWSQRWIWAIPIASLCQLIIVPVTLVIANYLSRKHKKTEFKN